MDETELDDLAAGGAMIYMIKAWWPNATTEPLVKRSVHLADALEIAVSLMYSHKHTTIYVLTPYNLELVRLWGQPPSEGKNWP